MSSEFLFKSNEEGLVFLWVGLTFLAPFSWRRALGGLLMPPRSSAGLSPYLPRTEYGSKLFSSQQWDVRELGGGEVGFEGETNELF